jgi:hypothetical protein
MPPSSINEGPEDSFGLPELESAADRKIADMLAWDAMQSAWYRLQMRAAEGDAWAIDRLADLAADLADLFTPRHPDEMTDDCRRALEAKAAQMPEWPAMVPADARSRAKVLQQIDSLGLGSSALFRVYQGKGGRPPDSHIDGSPSHVAKLLVLRLHGLRRIMSSRARVQVTALEHRYDVQFLEAVFGLPRFSRESLDQWTEQAVKFALDARYRAELIPKKWDEEAAGDKGRNALARRKIRDGMKAIVPD